jgi:hypothetical protein
MTVLFQIVGTCFALVGFAAVVIAGSILGQIAGLLSILIGVVSILGAEILRALRVDKFAGVKPDSLQRPGAMHPAARTVTLGETLTPQIRLSEATLDAREQRFVDVRSPR